MTTLVVGATGKTGQPLVEQLLGRNHKKKDWRGIFLPLTSGKCVPIHRGILQAGSAGTNRSTLLKKFTYNWLSIIAPPR